MTDSIHQDIVDAFKTLLQTITVVNGYETNLGNNVYEWRPTALEENELPGLVFRDKPGKTDIAIGKHQHNLDVEIEIKVSGSTVSATMRKCIADVIKCIGTQNTIGGTCLSGLAEDIIYGDAPEIETDQANKYFGSILMKFTIIFLTNPWNPYTNT